MTELTSGRRVVVHVFLDVPLGIPAEDIPMWAMQAFAVSAPYLHLVKEIRLDQQMLKPTPGVLT